MKIHSRKRELSFFCFPGRFTEYLLKEMHIALPCIMPTHFSHDSEKKLSSLEREFPMKHFLSCEKALCEGTTSCNLRLDEMELHKIYGLTH